MDPTSKDLSRERTMQVCFSQDNLKILEEYARKNGMLDYSQAIELLAKE